MLQSACWSPLFRAGPDVPAERLPSHHSSVGSPSQFDLFYVTVSPCCPYSSPSISHLLCFLNILLHFSLFPIFPLLLSVPVPLPLLPSSPLPPPRSPFLPMSSIVLPIFLLHPFPSLSSFLICPPSLHYNYAIFFNAVFCN